AARDAVGDEAADLLERHALGCRRLLARAVAVVAVEVARPRDVDLDAAAMPAMARPDERRREPRDAEELPAGREPAAPARPAHAHVSPNVAGRFCRNAITPSRKSPVCAARIWLRSSIATAASSDGASIESLRHSFVKRRPMGEFRAMSSAIARAAVS